MTISKAAPRYKGKIHPAFVDMIEELASGDMFKTQRVNIKESEPVNRTQNPKHKIAANKIIIPIIFVLVILHVLIIALIMMINTSSSILATTQQNAGIYTQDATSMLAGSSLLSETSSNFILVPLTMDGEVNLMPLNAYAAELSNDRRGYQVVERFQNYDVSEPVKGILADAANSTAYMMNNQLHALSLMRSIYEIPDVPPINQIPWVELSEEELNMPAAVREGLAKSLILGMEYSENKQNVSVNVNQAAAMIQGASAATAGAMSARIAKLRTALWIVTASIIIILTITFIMMYRWILKPLGNFAKQIPTGDLLDEEKGFKEITVVATAYNDVLKRRNALDAILRSAAETDALTNLQNRYSFEQYILESEENASSVAVVLFDVNYLKQTNDTLGHLAGDKLICTAAHCISSNFGDKCYRFGGDEFAAIVENCTQDSLNQMIENFKQAEKDHKVSISFGYAYTDELSSTTYKSLIDEADQNMYIQKREAHKEKEAHQID